MKETFSKCYCDNCKCEMSEYEYDKAVKIRLRADVMEPNGNCGDCNGITIKICDNCAKEIGLLPKEIHDGTMGCRERIGFSLHKYKNKILSWFFRA